MAVLTTFQVQLHSNTDTGNFKERENDDVDDFRAACRKKLFLPVVYGSV